MNLVHNIARVDIIALLFSWAFSLQRNNREVKRKGITSHNLLLFANYWLRLAVRFIQCEIETHSHVGPK